ncbi:MAG: hypothetical protein U0105_27300 [Candidatus Obscuribacterales bacterium]
MVLVCVGGGAALPAAPPGVRIWGAVDGPFGSGEGGGAVAAGVCRSACLLLLEDGMRRLSGSGGRSR